MSYEGNAKPDYFLHSAKAGLDFENKASMM